MTNQQNNQEEKSSFKENWQTFKNNNPYISKGILGVIGIGITAISFVLLMFIFVYLGLFGSLPSTKEISEIQNAAAAEIYAADGKVLGKFYTENRINVDYKDISPHLINALIATEDARFFDHSGIDMRAWLRVLAKTIMMNDESSGGGSTLSQQLAKNIYKRKRHRFLSVLVNKIKETYIARRLERVYSKKELIALYLNTVPFGGNIYGAEVASRQFFNKSVGSLKIEEAAVLVGMLKANTYYHPIRHPERSEKRRNVVLGQMEKYGYLKAEQVAALKKIPLKTNYQKDGNHEGIATYFREHIRQELVDIISGYKRPDGDAYNLYTDGLKIYTTIDSRLQEYAEQSLKSHLAKLQEDFDAHWKGQKVWGTNEVIAKEVSKSNRYKRLKKQGVSTANIQKNFAKPVRMSIFSHEGEKVVEMSPIDSVKYYYGILNAGFMAMNPKNGHVLAWVGGIDHEYFQYDHTQARRQVGSTFKPIVYTQAIRQGIRPCDYQNNRLVTYSDYEDWKPENADGHYGGVYSLAGGLRKSVNSIAVNLIMQTGVDSVVDLAHKMGIHNEIPSVPAIALGVADLSLYEMVQVYSTIANRGVRNTPTYITKIETVEGQILYDLNTTENSISEAVIRPEEADMITKMMEGVVDSGTAVRLRAKYALEMPIAGKTGTTQSHADGWFIGFTPDIVAGAWVGGASRRVRFRNISLGQGANTALPIWANFVKNTYEDPSFKTWNYHYFPEPSVETVAALSCPDYLEVEPVFYQEEEDIYDDGEPAVIIPHQKGRNHSIDEAIGILKKTKRSRTNTSSRSDVEKRNERKKRKRRRKEKRKKFFKKIFG